MSETFTEFLKLLPHYQDLKHQMLALLSDADLAHSIPGSPSLGALCKEIGETEQSYIDSFKTLKLNFSYRNPDTSLTTSTAALADWYADMDKEMQAVLDAFTDEDLETKPLGRGNWMVPIELNLDIYLQAVMIFCGKAWVHLHALGKELPEQWADWIG
jgi:uncharacterized damage-inducible protein DinB